MTIRYAIYFTLPQTDPLYRLASSWLGHDLYAQAAEPAPLPGILVSLPGLTTNAGRYGFHATLKAPFRLQSAASEMDLHAAFGEFAALQAPFSISSLALKRIGSFLALVPTAPSSELQNLAAACVSQFDEFRAPMTAAEIERRRPARLSPRQRQYLHRWGYPHVLDEFRFHMTLTDSLPEDRCGEAERCLEAAFKPLLGTPVVVDRLSLLRQPSPDRHFCIIDQQPLRG